MGELNTSLVCDFGGYNCRIGYSSNDAPELKFRSIVSLDDDELVGGGEGNPCLSNYVSPIERGFIVDWERMEKVWDYAFKSINCDTKDCSVLMTEAILNPNINRERMIQVLFELFGVSFGYVSLEAVLNVFSCGTTTALSVVMGDGTSQVLPMIQGHVIPTGLFRSDFGGGDITLYLMKLLEENGKLNFNRNFVSNIKEKHCDCNGDGSESVYNLPDGGTVVIGDETRRAAELMFDSSPISNGETSIPDLILKSIENSEMSLRWLLYDNIVIAGGNSLMKNFSDELRVNLGNRLSKNNQTKVVAAPERAYSVWIGGSILTSLTSFQNMWISKKDYEDYGTAIIYRR